LIINKNSLVFTDSAGCFAAGSHNTILDTRNYEGKIKMNNVWILAQTDSNQTSSQVLSEPTESEGQTTTTTMTSSEPNAPGQAPTQPGKPSPLTQFLPIILIFIVMYFLLFRGPRKKQQQHKQMVQSLAKNDRIQTIGGIIGTIVDIKDNEITLKVDESNNTKIKILRSAIGKNLSKD
jgi:preprotein translocase subunit YajC